MSILICTPIVGRLDSAVVALRYHQERLRIARDPNVHWLESELFLQCDIVRARSRACRMFLETECQYLLFWDDDNAPRNAATWLQAMIAADKDVIGCPYPKKHHDFVDLRDRLVQYMAKADANGQAWSDAVDAITPAMLESWSEEMVMRTTRTQVVDGTAEVDGLGTGFLMIRRSVVERMTSFYADGGRLELDPPRMMFSDSGKQTAALFQVFIDDREKLNSEDYAFCARWRAMGGKVHMLCAPIDHVGPAVYQGHPEGLFT